MIPNCETICYGAAARYKRHVCGLPMVAAVFNGCSSQTISSSICSNVLPEHKRLTSESFGWTHYPRRRPWTHFWHLTIAAVSSRELQTSARYSSVRAVDLLNRREIRPNFYQIRPARITKNSDEKRANNNNHKNDRRKYDDFFQSLFGSIFVLKVKRFVQFVRQNILLK